MEQTLHTVGQDSGPLESTYTAALESALTEILHLLGVGSDGSPAGPQSLREPLTESERRVIRYLPTNLSKREIADELYVSLHTVKTHIKHIYSKLDAHNRTEAVERARECGLLGRRSRNQLVAV